MVSITRRNMLKAAGAGAFATQFSSRFARQAHAAGPKRFIMFWHANGAPKPGDYGVFGGTGVSVKGYSHEGNGDHKMGMPFSTTGKAVNPVASISIDQAIAKATGKPALVLTGKAKHQNYRGWCSYDNSGKAILPMENPRAAFISVFGTDPGGGGSGSTPPPPTTPGTPPPAGFSPEVERKILQNALADMDDLRKRVPDSEIGKMKAHLDALTTLSQSLGPVSGGPLQQALSVSECNDKSKLALPFKEPMNGFEFSARVNMHIELIVAAFLCDARRVATLMVTPGGHDSMEYSFIGVPGEDPHNTIAHSTPKVAAAVAKMTKIKELDLGFLAKLVKRLKETPDPSGGTLWDSTLILSTTECSHGNHGPNPVPVGVGGGLGGSVGGGSYVDMLRACARTMGGSF